jgi:signal transduction histidine kinase/DNA-binding response OmpR family regulator
VPDDSLPLDLETRLILETQARQQAERELARKTGELRAANRELAGMADELAEEVDSANQATFRAERRLWDAVAGMRNGFALFDADQRLVEANEAYRFFFTQLSLPMMVGDSFTTLATVLADSGIIMFEGKSRDEWLADITSWHRSSELSHRIIRMRGDVWLKAWAKHTPSGDTVSLIADISAAKRREGELLDAQQQAEAASRAKSAFLANMSHEIRTPMNGVVGMADLLCETSLSEEQQLFAETIRNSGEALLVIINDVLDYSKIEAGKLEMFPERFNLERCVHEVTLLLQPRAREKNLDLLIDYDMFLPAHYIGDAGRVRQVLTNLVGNAIKFTSEGFVLVRVVGIEGADGDTEIHVAVEDSGIGIPADKLEHVFGEFNQVDDQTNRKFEGTGLGLAITKRLISLMGGEIWVESTPGIGACFGFRIVLPSCVEDPGPVTSVDPALKRALIVDDLEVNRLILARQLGVLGLEVTSCDSAPAALDLVASDPAFDVILTDHQMPDMGGVELARELAARQAQVPVLLLSSGNAVPANVRAENLFAATLRKPILRGELCDALAALGTQPRGKVEKAVKPVAKRPAARRSLRLLTAEDNRTNQLVLSKMVRSLDVELDLANTGFEAVEMFRKGDYDLIFMDISMPEMDGIEATRNIRAIEAEQARAPIPIMALTAHAMSGDKERFLAAGMDDYLTKPLKKALISNKLDQVRANLPRATPS